MKNIWATIAALSVFFVCVKSSGAHAQNQDPVTAPVPRLDAVLEDGRRAIYLEVSLRDDGTVTILDLGVTDVPPGATDDDPPMLMLQMLGRQGQPLAQQNGWDPRFEYQRTESEETVERLEEGTGTFQVPFDTRIAQIELVDLQQEPPETLTVVNVQTVIDAFCSENLTDVNCDGWLPGDINGDGIVDVEDYYSLRSALGKCEGQEGFIAVADYTADQCVAYDDYQFWLANYYVGEDLPAGPPAGC